jgi:hypothetical protein
MVMGASSPAARALPPGSDLVVTVAAASDPVAAAAKALERSVFLDVFGNTGELMDAEYGRYEHASVLLAVEDRATDQPAGMVRVLVDSPVGFKSLDDLGPWWGVPASQAIARAGFSWDPAHTWDLATLAVHPRYRGGPTGGEVSFALYQTLTALAVACEVTRFVTVLDVAVAGLVEAALGAPFASFPGLSARAYLDSPASVPLHCDVPAWLARLRLSDPALHRRLLHPPPGPIRPVDLRQGRAVVERVRAAAHAQPRQARPVPARPTPPVR